MKDHIIDVASNIRVCVIGIGFQGGQSVACMRQNHSFQGLPFKYVAIDTHSSSFSPSAFDELLLIEMPLAKEDVIAPLVLIDYLTRQKLESWRTELDCIFIISALEDDAITALTAETVSLLKKTDQAMVINIVTEPESESAQLTFQKCISQIKSICDCVITSSASQIHRQLAEEPQMNNTPWYWPYQYQAACNITYGIIGSQFSHGVIGVDFADIKNILQSGRDIKTVYVSAVGEDRVEQVAEKALFILRQEGWRLTDPEIVAFMSNAITTHNDEFSLGEFDQIAATLLEEQPLDRNCKVTMSFNQAMMEDEIDLFVLAVKAGKHKNKYM